MKFLFGIAAGALGMWAYQSGKFEAFTGGGGGRVTESLRNAAETVQGSVRPSGDIATPSASEVSGRPSEPLPTTGA